MKNDRKRGHLAKPLLPISLRVAGSARKKVRKEISDVTGTFRRVMLGHRPMLSIIAEGRDRSCGMEQRGE
ncbi:hypothetical protein [Sphingomonas sp. Sph1(2015)]|uniref:hypothetical protein n=1 Tax=Sphingomonas sp. Sph1(2015) TaxID=1628084 RepID=UPI001301893A|nr:hypothetical protein [Sphingomonas sp. Sph1(2015)]